MIELLPLGTAVPCAPFVTIVTPVVTNGAPPGVSLANTSVVTAVFCGVVAASFVAVGATAVMVTVTVAVEHSGVGVLLSQIVY